MWCPHACFLTVVYTSSQYASRHILPRDVHCELDAYWQQDLTLSVIVGRILFQTTIAPGHTESVYYSNPTALASLTLGQLCKTNMASKIDSFLAAGGVAALVHVLKKSTCPLTLNYTLSSLETLLKWLVDVPRPRKWIPDPAEGLLEAGERRVGCHNDLLM